MSDQFFFIGFSLLWVLMCGRVWWVVGRQHVWQRRLIAVGAGLGAALIYLISSTLWEAVKRKEPPQPLLQSGEEVRIRPTVPANQ